MTFTDRSTPNHWALLRVLSRGLAVPRVRPGELTLPTPPLRLLTYSPPVLASVTGSVTAGRLRVTLPDAGHGHALVRSRRSSGAAL